MHAHCCTTVLIYTVQRTDGKGSVQANLGLIHRPKQRKEVVCRSIAHEDEVIWGVLVVTGCVQGNHALQECF